MEAQILSVAEARARQLCRLCGLPIEYPAPGDPDFGPGLSAGWCAAVESGGREYAHAACVQTVLGRAS